MLRSGALARRWVGSLHCLGSSLDLKDSMLETKGLAAHTWTPTVDEARQAEGQSVGALGRRWTPLGTPLGGRTRHRPSGGSLGPRALERSLLGSALPGARSRPRHKEETAGNYGSVQSGESPWRQLRQGH